MTCQYPAGYCGGKNYMPRRAGIKLGGGGVLSENLGGVVRRTL